MVQENNNSNNILLQKQEEVSETLHALGINSSSITSIPRLDRISKVAETVADMVEARNEAERLRRKIKELELELMDNELYGELDLENISLQTGINENIILDDPVLIRIVELYRSIADED